MEEEAIKSSCMQHDRVRAENSARNRTAEPGCASGGAGCWCVCAILICMLNPARLPVIEEVVSRKLDAESPVAASGGDVAEGQRWSMLQVSGDGSFEAPCSLTPQASPPKAKRKHDGSVTSKGGGGRHGDEAPCCALHAACCALHAL